MLLSRPVLTLCRYQSGLPQTFTDGTKCHCLSVNMERKREQITPILASLHWLPVHFRIDFKVLVLVYKSLKGLAPSYFLI